MTFDRIVNVLIICLPVFALIGLGKLLERQGLFSEDRRRFANWLVYWLALPAILLHKVSGQSPKAFWNLSMLLTLIISLLVLIVIYTLVARAWGHVGGFAAATVFGTFWANISYIGLPLSENAFGEQGLAQAAIYNALGMPLYIILAYLLIGIYDRSQKMSVLASLKKAVCNPLILSVFIGMAIAVIGEKLGYQDWSDSSLSKGLVALVASFLELIGGMGLPLALLTIGAALKLTAFRGRMMPLVLTVAGKLILFPLLAYIVLTVGFPEGDPLIRNVTVLLCAMPCAVASYVIACQIGVDESFVSCMLVVSTVVSMITIPVWLYILI